MPNTLHRVEYEVFRTLLVKARHESLCTQVQIARALGKPQSFVSKYERGERRLDLTEFLDVAAAMGIDPVEFISALRKQIEDRRTPDKPQIRRGSGLG